MQNERRCSYKATKLIHGEDALLETEVLSSHEDVLRDDPHAGRGSLQGSLERRPKGEAGPKRNLHGACRKNAHTSKMCVTTLMTSVRMNSLPKSDIAKTSEAEC